VNGGTKLQELPEIKNCVADATPNGQKGKKEALAKEKKYARKVRKPACGRPTYHRQAGRKES
jgi:hypothetical protein